jgi:predicted transposase/invertase (TIGR01784 family)
LPPAARAVIVLKEGIPMGKKRLKPLNDFAFQKVMGEKGSELQLLAFLNAVLTRTGKGNLTSVEIIENKELPADIAGAKAARLDVLAKLADGSQINVEVQLKNEHNIEKRSLFYWSSGYIRDFRQGDDYYDLLPVITINILGFGYLPLKDFHTSFHLWEDREKDYMLTDVCEIHFLDTVKFRRLKGAGGLDLGNPLHRWLTWFDENSPEGLVEEVVKMDRAILMAQKKLEVIARNPEWLRAYEGYEKAASDWTSSINGARRDGEQKKVLEVARNLKVEGLPLDTIARVTGLSGEMLKNL